VSGESKRKKKSRQLLEIPRDIREKVEETLRTILGEVQVSGKTKIVIKEQEASQEELERILSDIIALDPGELSEYMSTKEMLGALISAVYYVKKIAATRPASPNSKLILMYFRTIDAIAAMLVEMIKNARGIVLERTIQIKQVAVMREDPLEELERLETILIMLDGLRKHIKNIIDEMDT